MRIQTLERNMVIPDAYEDPGVPRAFQVADDRLDDLRRAKLSSKLVLPEFWLPGEGAPVDLAPGTREWLKWLLGAAIRAGNPPSGGAAAGRSAFSVNTSGAAIALAAATAKTVMNVIAATNVVPTLVEAYLGFDGVTASAVPVLVDLCGSTQGAAGTTTSFTLVQTRGGQTQVSGCTSAVNYTAEPTTLVVLKQWLVDPNKGGLLLQFPLGREHHGTGAAASMFKGLCLRCTAPAIVNVRGYLEVESD